MVELDVTNVENFSVTFQMGNLDLESLEYWKKGYRPVFKKKKIYEKGQLSEIFELRTVRAEYFPKIFFHIIFFCRTRRWAYFFDGEKINSRRKKSLNRPILSCNDSNSNKRKIYTKITSDPFTLTLCTINKIELFLVII